MSAYDQLTEQLGLAVGEIIKLRAALATVTAEREALRWDFLAAFSDRAQMIEALATERAAHEETKAEHTRKMRHATKALEQQAVDLESTRAAHEETKRALALAAQQVGDLARRSTDDLESTRAALAKAEAQLATEQDAGRQYRERISAEESALDRERDLTQKLGARLERLQTASALACRAWEHTPNYSVHEIRGVMRELRALLSPGGGTGGGK